MKKTALLTELQESIRVLEIKQIEEEASLKQDVKSLYEGLNPLTLVKNTIDEFISSPNLKENVLDTSLSLMVGYLSKKWIVGSSQNKFKQMAGNLVQMGVTKVVSKNIASIRSIASFFVQKKEQEIDV